MPVSAAAADIAKAVATMASLVVPAATSAVAPEPQAEAPAPASAPASTKSAAPVAKEKTAKTSSVQPTAPAAKAKPVKEPAAAQPAAPVTAPEAHQAEAPAEKQAQASAPAIPVEVPAFLAVAPVAEPPPGARGQQVQARRVAASRAKKHADPGHRRRQTEQPRSCSLAARTSSAGRLICSRQILTHQGPLPKGRRPFFLAGLAIFIR